MDASAIVAILQKEADGPDFALRIERGGLIYVSPVVLWEVNLALSRASNITFEGATNFVDAFVARSSATILDITPAIGRLAIDASRRYGRGRHRAGLNLGDCFAYAAAKAHGLPLLFKGDDFPHTDIVPA